MCAQRLPTVECFVSFFSVSASAVWDRVWKPKVKLGTILGAIKRWLHDAHIKHRPIGEINDQRYCRVSSNEQQHIFFVGKNTFYFWLPKMLSWRLEQRNRPLEHDVYLTLSGKRQNTFIAFEYWKSIFSFFFFQKRHEFKTENEPEFQLQYGLARHIMQNGIIADKWTTEIATVSPSAAAAAGVAATAAPMATADASVSSSAQRFLWKRKTKWQPQRE